MKKQNYIPGSKPSTKAKQRPKNKQKSLPKGMSELSDMFKKMNVNPEKMMNVDAARQFFSKEMKKGNNKQKFEQFKNIMKGDKLNLPKMMMNAMLPINSQKEKDIFFDNECQTNPIFIFPNTMNKKMQEMKEKMMGESKRQPNSEFIPLCLKILKKAKQLKYYQKMNNGEYLTEIDTRQVFQSYINNLKVEKFIDIEFTQNSVASTCIVHSPVGNSKVMIGLPVRYTPETIEGILHHEVGTHFLRRYNDKKQPWHQNRKKYGLSNMEKFMETEEGLATLNTYLPNIIQDNLPPLLYIPAILYMACYLSSQSTFSQLFELMSQYLPDPDFLWRLCVRVKGRMGDTSKKGGNYRDQIYMTGVVNILKNRSKINFAAFHCGSLSVEDYMKMADKKMILKGGMILPEFVKDMPTYMKCLDVIAEYNGIK